MLRQTRWIAWIAAFIYFAQGALGISGIALLLYLRRLEWSISEITEVMSLGALPWVLKILYGFVSDTVPIFGYRRKTYLMLCALISALGWVFLSAGAEDRGLILCFLLIANLGFAATDVTVDGLIVEHSTAVSSHIYQSIAWGFRSAGAILSSLAGGWLAAHWPARDVFILSVILALSVFAVSFFIREKKWPGAPFEKKLDPFRKCMELVKTSNLRWMMILFVIIALPSTFGLPFFFFMNEKLGFHETFLGLLGSLGWFGAMLGSIIYLRWLKKLNPKKILNWAICLNCANILGALLVFDTRSAFVLLFIGGIIGCITILPMVSAAAALTRHSGIESMMFAILMSIYNSGQIFFGFSGGKLYHWIGLYPLIVISAVVSLTGLIFVRRLDFGRAAKV